MAPSCNYQRCSKTDIPHAVVVVVVLVVIDVGSRLLPMLLFVHPFLVHSTRQKDTGRDVCVTHQKVMKTFNPRLRSRLQIPTPPRNVTLNSVRVGRRKQMILISLLSLPSSTSLSLEFSSISFSFFRPPRDRAPPSPSLPRRLSLLLRPLLLSHFLLRAFTFTRRRREDLAAKPSFLEAHLDTCFEKINLVQVICGLLVAAQ